MACNFNSNQFERAYNPKALGNWQVPVRKSERPKTRTGRTEFIADHRGHLLPEVACSKRTARPWNCGPFTAWDYPKKITRSYAKQMETAANKRFSAWLKRSAHIPLPQQEAPPTPLPPAHSRVDSVPKSSRSSSVGQLSEVRSVQSSTRTSNRPRTASVASQRSASVGSTKTSSSTKLPPPANSLNSSQSPPPLAKAYSTMQAAKILASESHTHQPLADAVVDPVLHTPIINKKHQLTTKEQGTSPRTLSTPKKRPSTCHPLQKVTEIDLAIRWDLPGGEKLLSQHPSKFAPAVFNLVAPVEEIPPLALESAFQKTSSPAPVKAKNPGLAKHRSKSASNLAAKPSKSEMKRFPDGEKCENKRPHTAAPGKVQNAVPKPKMPFSKRSYSIGTLAPPFSLWPDGTKRQDYPDHWRLASVYQHSYKPVHLRKKTLLASIFQ
ncbi:putative uncharacterized protein ENSP00000383309 [Neocloeon triangulifer]|uniref:putative uncharacterized protein ENSP00000383309 n=1 Tax=Neocloeon triangulifer TaxID=2078957 RepID=UPI00286EC807|nr:putative uncharacterized protein ENSP00000383309 [Neocloeon triangulifer]